MFEVIAAAIAAVFASVAGGAPTSQPQTPAIAIEAPPSGKWTISYRLPHPVSRLVFARSPDASRAGTWSAPDGFVIDREGDSEVLRRTDGASFGKAKVHVPPVYRVLPKDYAPFSPFGDGGMLVHSGRFFACSDTCRDDERWAFSLAVPDDRAILVDGQRHVKSASWTDSGEGRNIYVGKARPIENSDVVAVIDNSLPPNIRSQLEQQLPVFMHYYSTQLGALPSKPMLFASYDVTHRPGRGSQGGTLPGQVFTHFYGDIGPLLMADQSFALKVSWFFAHEAGHLYQRQLSTPDATGAWIHEGGADAFAAIALEEIDTASNAHLQQLLEARSASCSKLLAGGSMHDALAAGRFNAAYDCGLLLNLALHRALLADRPDSGGLFAVWRNYIAAADAGSQPSEELFLASVAKAGGPRLAEKVKAAVSASDPLALELR
jgi:hypothetical protein